ncbi:MAG: type II secretion system protein GspM [Thermodesulfobacteriota bacterium]|nr:type II secretion system protein GspM [Thermodesulfobacteriota bacterium]
MKVNDLTYRIRSYINSLNPRERYVLLFGAAAVFVFLMIRLIVFPLAGKQKALARALVEKKLALSEMTALQREYEAIRQQASRASSRFQSRQPGFTLFSFLDTLAGRAGVKGNIVYMKPSTASAGEAGQELSVVEMKLDAVNLERLVGYLRMIETSPNMVFVKRLSITRQEKTAGGVDVLMQVETVKG